MAPMFALTAVGALCAARAATELIPLIKRLRELTNYGVSDCREALERAGGNLDLALEMLPAIWRERT